MSDLLFRLRKMAKKSKSAAGPAIAFVACLIAILGSIATVLTNLETIQNFWHRHFTPSHESIVLNELQNIGDEQLIEAVRRKREMALESMRSSYVAPPTHFIGVILRAKFADSENSNDEGVKSALRYLSVEPEDVGFPDLRASPIGPEFVRLPGRSLAWAGIVSYWGAAPKPEAVLNVSAGPLKWKVLFGSHHWFDVKTPDGVLPHSFTEATLPIQEFPAAFIRTVRLLPTATPGQSLLDILVTNPLDHDYPVQNLLIHAVKHKRDDGRRCARGPTDEVTDVNIDWDRLSGSGANGAATSSLFGSKIPIKAHASEGDCGGSYAFEADIPLSSSIGAGQSTHIVIRLSGTSNGDVNYPASLLKFPDIELTLNSAEQSVPIFPRPYPIKNHLGDDDTQGVAYRGYCDVPLPGRLIPDCFFEDPLWIVSK